jgi:hypothetical protein
MIRQSWFPQGTTSANWVMLEPPSSKEDDKDYINTVTNELITLDIFGEPKVVLLRGFPTRKEFREWLVSQVPLIANPNTLVLWDVDGNIADDGDWAAVREVIKNNGQCVARPLPLNAKRKGARGKPQDVYSEQDKVRYIVHAFQTKNLNVSAETASLLLAMLGADRGMIDSEVEKLSLMNVPITPELLRECVIPITQDYPIYHFYSAFNSGNYASILVSAQSLISRMKMRPEGVMNLALKQLRWQLVGADAFRREQDMHSAIRKMGESKDVDAVRKRVSTRLSWRMLCKSQATMLANPDTEVKQETLTYDPMIQEVVGFIEYRLLRLVPPGTDPKLWVYRAAIDRYLLAQRALVDLRLNPSVSLLNQELRKLALT